MPKLAATLAAVALTAALTVTGAHPAQALSPADPTTEATEPTAAPLSALFDQIFNDPTIPACEYEDGSEMLDEAATADPELDQVQQRACKWDAGESGNGVGSSFVVILTPRADGGAELVYVYADGTISL